MRISWLILDERTAERCFTGWLRQANAQQADDILRLQTEAMQLQAVAADNKRLLGDITSLHKASPLEAGLGITEACEVTCPCQSRKVKS